MGSAAQKPRSRSIAVLMAVLSGLVLVLGLTAAPDWRSAGLSGGMGLVGLLVSAVLFAGASRSHRAAGPDEGHNVHSMPAGSETTRSGR